VAVGDDPESYAVRFRQNGVRGDPEIAQPSRLGSPSRMCRPTPQNAAQNYRAEFPYGNIRHRGLPTQHVGRVQRPCR
jgi:hypothetical protein